MFHEKIFGKFDWIPKFCFTALQQQLSCNSLHRTGFTWGSSLHATAAKCFQVIRTAVFGAAGCHISSMLSYPSFVLRRMIVLALWWWSSQLYLQLQPDLPHYLFIYDRREVVCITSCQASSEKLCVSSHGWEHAPERERDAERVRWELQCASPKACRIQPQGTCGVRVVVFELKAYSYSI